MSKLLIIEAIVDPGSFDCWILSALDSAEKASSFGDRIQTVDVAESSSRDGAAQVVVLDGHGFRDEVNRVQRLLQAHNEIPIFRRGGQSTIPGIHGAIVQCLLMEE